MVKPYKMSRSIAAVAVAALALLQAVSAIDVSQNKNVRLEFGTSDVVQKTRLQLDSNPDDRATNFIGDLTIGQRYADETVFRRVVQFNNPTNIVQSTNLDVSITNGIIHYINAQNVQNSQAVVCGDANTLGGSKSTINLRVSPNSLATLTLIVAAH